MSDVEELPEVSPPDNAQDDGESCADSVTVEAGVPSEGTSEPMSDSALIEGLLFAHGEELSLERIAEVSRLPRDRVEGVLRELFDRYQHRDHGVELVQVAGKFQFRTKGDIARFVRELKAAKPRRLSAAALETLAIVAYRQPIVKSDIEQIRGVDVTPTLKTLLERSLIRIVGHQPSVGSPALYGTTEEFLAIFGLNSLSELPTLRDLKELDDEPGENSSEGSEDASGAAEEGVEQSGPDSEESAVSA